MWDEDESEVQYEVRPTRRFRWMDAVVMAVGLPLEVIRGIADWLEDLVELLGKHANWQLEQEQAPVKVTP